MSELDFKPIFKAATGFESPFGYQCRLACGDEADPENADSLRSGTPCESKLINVPTGLGKTAGVVLAWLWNRILHPSEDNRKSWPRRLVYCLPMRTLVEQTRDNVERWLRDLRQEFGTNYGELCWLTENSPIILMGGEDSDPNKAQWDLYPEKPAILIGTQDMLLSRALNRGYGMSRYRWPMHFGLLNNDCLWVMDETQLMGPGLSTASQLEAFRLPRESKPAGFNSAGASRSVTWYMSATSNRDHLNTRDWRDVARPLGFDFDLHPQEKAATAGPIYQRRCAIKQLELRPDLNFESSQNANGLIQELLNRHREMASTTACNSNLPKRTLIICNTVDRAVAVYKRLEPLKPEGCDLLLLHSRFRPIERRERMQRLTTDKLSSFPDGQIVVSTQVIEAGVDVSSSILCTEIAPLASLVQRLGRLNRAGEFNGSPWKPVAVIVGLGVEMAPSRETKEAREKREQRNVKRCLPYQVSACDESTWDILGKLNNDASPANLERLQDEIAASIPRCSYSLQRHELMDFFDTDANLSLGFTDVSPFVRGLDDDTDVQVVWRDAWPEKDGEPDFTPDYQRNEFCSVPVSKANDAREVLNCGWIWRGKESGWISIRAAGIAPGMTILLPVSAGGYDTSLGWTGKKEDNKHSSLYEPGSEPSDEESLSCLVHGWRSIGAHTAEVNNELRALSGKLVVELAESELEALLNAVPWHDIGKNHPAWQGAAAAALERANIGGKDEHRPFAKLSLSESPLLLQNGKRLTGCACERRPTSFVVFSVRASPTRRPPPSPSASLSSSASARRATQTSPACSRSM